MKMKLELHWCWNILAILMSVSIAASVCFGILHWQRRNQWLLSWKNDCWDNGGTWSVRRVKDSVMNYREYVCRLEER